MKSLKKLLGSKGSSEPKDPSSKSSKDQILSSPILPPGIYGTFPPSFSIYLAGSSQDKKSDFFTLCQTQTLGQNVPQPLNAITVHKGLGKHHLTLYSSPRYDSLPLALGGIEKFFSGTAILALPAPVGAEPKNQIETIKDHKSWTADLHSFSASVGTRTERFEWRGDNVRRAGKKPYERKLVRLGTGQGQGTEEIVGIWTDEQDPQTLAAGNLGTFAFQGSGATGELGEYWTLLAVASCVKLFQNTWEARAAVDKIIKAASNLLGAGLEMGVG